MDTIRYQLADGIATLTFDEPGSPVNTMGAQWQHDMGAAVQQVLADQGAIRGIVLASAKSTFFAGADLKGVLRLQPQDAARVFREIEQVKKNFRMLETLGKPVVACLNGSALGGGWEIALVAHHRVAVDDAKIQLGLPEITLGLIPGASGITKMTRLLGLQDAQPFILESRLFSPREGLELGLVHELVDDASALRERALAWIAAHPQVQQPWDAKDYRMPGGPPGSPKIAAMLAVAPAALQQKTRGLYPAPEAALAAMVEGAQVDFDTALRIESRYLARLIVSPVARNMINTFFFDLNAVRSGKSRPATGTQKWRPHKVGILGAGMMGAGIAHAQASRGIATVLKDVSLARAQAGKSASARITQARVDQGRMSAQAQAELLARIVPTEAARDLEGCDLIIEAVFENRDLKARVTREAESLLAPGGIFASNTSTLPITGLAQASARPQHFVGIHFFSPVEKMKLVEIVRGHATDDHTVARAFDYVQALGKLPIVVNDGRGFFTSRVFGTFVMEGAAMIGEGLPAAVVEQAGLQAGMPVGPLAVLDETALSLAVHVLDQTRADARAEGGTYIATPGELLVERMVKEFDRNGRAAGGGFYEYPQEAGARKFLWPELPKIFGRPDPVWELQDLKDRLLYRQSVETARCLAEGVLTSVHDANIGSIFGIGFPGWTGGAMQFIYGTGVDAFLRRARELAAKYGPGFDVAPEVVDAIRRHEPRW
ncbi:3-hydroxyacyl-CoA dehydrogenase NAD-binding domain-containing protein [Ramlibacter sp.]|uniref:3-hydroxyacyl-CoA dehydrogenase NAD-binding domain-containing protein n=1 Tax=Ramlibacter sp. TaxID=1917967 RepID=UPI00261CA658|nr:3-hydroxyacyl-CoA dehydrogenase NAD-binding domain-containing protein [Ramlibacter sp.]MDB5956663.1 enoyl-CoA hydratase/isomerase family protein [Ramlibacter sp.]